MTDQINSSSFLMNRAKAAKAKSAEKPAVANKPIERLAVSQAPKQSQPLLSPASKTVDAPHSEQNSHSEAKDESAIPESGAEVSSSEWDQQVWELFDTHAPDKMALNLVRPHLPEIVRKLIAGCKIIGAKGHQDRMTLYRMLGLPWTPSSPSIRGESGQGLDALANRMVRAVTRREGRVSVTLSADISEEGPTIAGEMVEGT